MAYRKARRKAPKRHKRRMGAVSVRRDAIQRTLGLVGGAALTGFLNGWISDYQTKNPGTVIDSKIIAIAEMAIGYFGPSFIGKRSDLVNGVGDGMIAAAGINLLRDLDVIKGIPVIAGWRELQTVSGVNDKPKADKEIQPSEQYTPSNLHSMYSQFTRRTADR